MKPGITATVAHPFSACELKNVLQPFALGWDSSWTSNDSLSEATKNFQRQTIQGTLLKNEGNWAATARDLRIDRSNLHKLATKLGLRKR